ncbi:MAG: DegT/DnrJ/EryC1/StrS family aminotransferase [Chloroflexota bacterium]
MQIPAAKIYFPETDRREILARVEEALSTGQLTLGKYTREFEQEYAKYIGTKYAVAVNSGTSALEIILRAIDIGGRSVIVPTNTFFASPASVVHAGGIVRFADVSDNLCLDPDSVARNVTRDTRAVMVVHIAGIVPPQIRDIQTICDKHGLLLIEDAAHAHGSSLDGLRAGAIGTAAAFSFYPTKVMTSAEGGMITTNDEKVYQRALVFRDQGKSGFERNLHTEMGYNWRMSEIHAVIGLHQLRRLNEFIANRRKVAGVFDHRLKEVKGIRALAIPAQVYSNYYKYVAYLDKGLNRDQVKKELREKHGVSLSGEVYELPCHLQPIFKGLGNEGDFPVAEDLCRRMVCLPVSAVMTEQEADYTVDALKEVLK